MSVAEDGWRVEVTRRGLTPLSVLLPEVFSAWDDPDDWLDGEDIPDGGSGRLSTIVVYLVTGLGLASLLARLADGTAPPSVYRQSRDIVD